MKKCFAFLLLCVALLLFPTIAVHAASTTYTYTYDYWGENRESPDAYTPERLVTGSDFGIGDFKDPQGLFVRDNRIYVCDTGNNRIVILERLGDKLSLVDVFSEFSGNTSILTFSSPQDIYVTQNGEMYICDTNNQRVVHITKDLQFVKQMERPVDETVSITSDFLPMKVVTDKSGRTIVLVKNYNKGFVTYKNNGEFGGYIGANEVKFDFTDYLWKMIATKKQREQLKQFVPTEYNNLALDKEDFIFCTTSVFVEHELKNDKAKPIRKLNAMGTDILIKNGVYPPIGDIWWGNAAGITGASKLVDITAMDNGTYYAIDRTRGRIFGYDSQGNLLYAFGSLGNKQGYFQYPTAIDHMENDLIVLDSKSAGITILKMTQFGQLIYNALAEYEKGNYDISADYWREVLMQNGNYDFAYIGIGRSLLRQEKYKEAMEYFKTKLDDDNYSKAFQLYRKEWIEEHITWIICGFFAIIAIPPLIGKIKKMKREVDEA